MLGVALLSFAHVHAEGYARNVQAHPEATITCIWDDDQARGTTAAARFSVAYESDLTTVLQRRDVDAVLINAPTSQHTELLLAACAAGKHIFTEKALTLTTADADRVVEAVHNSGIQCMVSLPSRTTPETLYMKQLIDSGALGKISLMRARIGHMAALDQWFHDGSAWFGDAEQAGGGALFDLGCHTVDVMRWLLGPPVSVIAKMQNFSKAYTIDDNSAVVVEFASGALGILDSSWVQRSGPNPIEIYGTEGFVGRGMGAFPSMSVSTTAMQERGYLLPAELPKALPMPLDQWVAACLHNSPTSIRVEDGRNLTEMLEGMYIAARTASEYRY